MQSKTLKELRTRVNIMQELINEPKTKTPAETVIALTGAIISLSGFLHGLEIATEEMAGKNE